MRRKVLLTGGLSEVRLRSRLLLLECPLKHLPDRRNARAFDAIRALAVCLECVVSTLLSSLVSSFLTRKGNQFPSRTYATPHQRIRSPLLYQLSYRVELEAKSHDTAT